MKREEEIIQAALNFANNQENIPIKDEFSKTLCIALGQAFMKGAKWADESRIVDFIEVEVKADSGGLFTTETWDEMSNLLCRIDAKAGDKVKIVIIKSEES